MPLCLRFVRSACHTRIVPSTDAKWIIGTLGGLLLVIGGLIINQNAGIRAEIAELRTDVRRAVGAGPGREISPP